MSQIPDLKPMASGEVCVPMDDVSGFVRQLSHDLRNHLNAAELQSAYISEVAENPELKDEIKRLRNTLSEMGDRLQEVAANLGQIKLTEMRYEASAFMEDLQQKVASQFPEWSVQIDWEMNAGTAVLEIDPQLLQGALLELIRNAIEHERGTGHVKIAGEATKEEFQFTLREPKAGFSASLENWGREPFRNPRRGHYSLGLHHARTIIEGHRGRMEVHYDEASSTLVTTVALPLAGAE